MPLDAAPDREAVLLPPAYSYVRFSTGRQIRGRSQRRQTEMAEAYAARHGRPLDATLKMIDLGRSAFTGAHRTKGGLGVFLSAVRAAKVPGGSWLIIESLDRLSREPPMESFDLISELTKAQIVVVVLESETHYSRESLNRSSGSGSFGELMGELNRAHRESRRKSDLSRDAWQARKARARAGHPLGKICPAWLRKSDDGTCYELIPSRAALVQQIVRWSIEGMGKTFIVKTLNADPARYPVMDKAGQGIRTKIVANGWHESHIAKILGNPALLGFGRPTFKNAATKGRREADGDLLINYFPPSLIKQCMMRRSRRAPRGRARASAASSSGTCSPGFASACAAGRRCGFDQTGIGGRRPGTGPNGRLYGTRATVWSAPTPTGTPAAPAATPWHTRSLSRRLSTRCPSYWSAHKRRWGKRAPTSSGKGPRCKPRSSGSRTA